MIWTEENVGRIITDLAAHILRSQHRNLVESARRPVHLDKDWGLDSVQRMELAAYVNEFFGLFDASADHYLLADAILDNWVARVLRARAETNETLVFFTSGSTGTPRRITHSLAFLRREAEWLAELLPPPRQVVTLVGSHHIYGFLFTVLLPALWQVPVVRGKGLDPLTLGEGALVIGTPFHWQYVHRSLAGRLPNGCRGVSSGAPLPSALFDELAGAGLDLTEIYGSTETAGLAYRQRPGDAFTLYPYLEPGPDGRSVRRSDHPEFLVLPDAIEWLPNRQLRVLGRLDGAVSIAGVNVYPAYVQRVLEGSPFVETCDVFAKKVEGEVRLFGTIKLRHLSDDTRQACTDWMRQRLTAPEIPRELYFY